MVRVNPNGKIILWVANAWLRKTENAFDRVKCRVVEFYKKVTAPYKIPRLEIIEKITEGSVILNEDAENLYVKHDYKPIMDKCI